MPSRAKQYAARTVPRPETRPDATQRGYDHRWRARRLAHLNANPLCVACAESGLVVEATVADHITPHRGDRALFMGPLQSLCETCHNKKTRRGE